MKNRTQAQAIIENAIVFGLPDKLLECDCDCDPVTIVRAVMAAAFARSIRTAVRDYLEQLDLEESADPGQVIAVNDDGARVVLPLKSTKTITSDELWYPKRPEEEEG